MSTTITTLVFAGAVLLSTMPTPARAQLSVSAGVGGGIAGSTDNSLSEGKSAAILMGQATFTALPLVSIGAEVNFWERTTQLVFATAIAKLHIPLTPLSIKVGGGLGNGDPDGHGKISGAAGEIGAELNFGIPVIPVGFTLFGNGFLAHTAARSVQMVDAGVAISWR